MSLPDAPWEIPSKPDCMMSLSMGGIPVCAYSKKYDQRVAIFNIHHNETFGGVYETYKIAQLVAAAPELMEALEYALDVSQEGLPLGDSWQSDARAIIAKAKGES